MCILSPLLSHPPLKGNVFTIRFFLHETPTYSNLNSFFLSFFSLSWFFHSLGHLLCTTLILYPAPPPHYSLFKLTTRLQTSGWAGTTTYYFCLFEVLWGGCEYSCLTTVVLNKETCQKWILPITLSLFSLGSSSGALNKLS